jgi:hypothetical protein
VSHLVLLNDLAEGNDLGAGETGEVVDLVATLAKFALVLGESSLALVGDRRVGAIGGLGLEALYAARKVI